MSFWNGREWVNEGSPDTEVKREGRVKHVAKAVAEAGLITVLTFGLVAGSAFAAKGGGNKPSGGSSTATLNLVLVRDANGDGAPNYGDTISFTSNTTASRAEVGFRCYQGSNFVFDGYVSLFDSWLNTELVLTSTQWDTARDANCAARLFTYDSRAREQVMKSMAVTVSP
jgi:hypothetical protein